MNDKEAEKEIREISTFTVATNNIKYLAKEVKDLFDKNFKCLKKEIEDTRKGKDLPCSWIGRIKIVKMEILPKTIYKFNGIPSKSQHNSSQTLKEQYSISYGKTKNPG